MSLTLWMAVGGALLLFLGLASAWLRWLPVSTSVLFLLFGIACGPAGAGWWSVDVRSIAPALELLSELAILVSLFVGGLKLRLPFGNRAWRPAYLLAGPVMLAGVLGVALFAYWVLELPVGLALLLGAILAPTDPVLASLVSVNHARDHDRMRFGLSGEAGFNDGMAFPFVILALGLIEHGGLSAGWLGQWLLHRLVWAVPASVALGFLLARGTGWLAIHLRSQHGDHSILPNQFLTLALIALSYAGGELIGGWGFLATFAAGVGLRRAELHAGQTETPSEELMAGAGPRRPEGASTHVSAPDDDSHPPEGAAGALMVDALAFCEVLERSAALVLVTFIGVAIADYWEPKALWLAAALFLLIRPLSARLILIDGNVDARQRRLIGWFGVRGISSLYYLCYAISHGLTAELVDPAIAYTLSIVALSIVVHGLTMQPLLTRYEARIEAPASQRA